MDLQTPLTPHDLKVAPLYWMKLFYLQPLGRLVPHHLL
jgi:hypothetical protein